ncbi:recombinase family protein [Ruminococcus flavefaciens]|uniref:recombinase family protein n=1 Tax=Ruminococcus flavefaciens TaxID=1265 RepID=UPI0004916F89|nr:recombinase family protein [Ruminococcus flavefaciens]
MYNSSEALDFSDLPDFSSFACNLKEESMPALLKVACYIRVSSDSFDQENSYEAQEQYFTKLLASHDDWDSVGVYSDYGISGTKQDNRSGLKRLLRHCEEGKVNRIICKSISRFSRNTADTIETVRHLLSIGVTCFFEKENLDTGDLKSEFILTTLAALAQEESRSISENICWGRGKLALRGDVPNEELYGYRFGDYETTETGYKRRTVKIIEEEAETVRRIFKLYVEGFGPVAIARILNEENAPAPNDGTGWTSSQIQLIVSNERYCGDVLTHKSYTESFLTHKTRKNRGEKQQLYIQDHHPAIVSREMFNKAKSRRCRGGYEKKTMTYPYSGRLKCACCGSNYHRLAGNSVYWLCCKVALRNGKKLCNSKRISEESLNVMFRKAVLTRFQTFNDLMALLETMQDMDYVERDRSIMKKQIAIAEAEYDDIQAECDRLKANIEVQGLRSELNGDSINISEMAEKLEEKQKIADNLRNEKESLEVELDEKESRWELMEKDYDARKTLVEIMELSTERELLDTLHLHIKALAISITVHSPTHITVLWFDETQTDIEI